MVGIKRILKGKNETGSSDPVFSRYHHTRI